MANFLAEDQTLLPEQFVPAPDSTPVRRLCAAMLEDLILVRGLAARRPRSRALQQLKADDEQWLAGGPAQISFEMVCDALGLDPSALRRALLRDEKSVGGFRQLNPKTLTNSTPDGEKS